MDTLFEILGDFFAEIFSVLFRPPASGARRRLARKKKNR